MCSIDGVIISRETPKHVVCVCVCGVGDDGNCHVVHLKSREMFCDLTQASTITS